MRKTFGGSTLDNYKEAVMHWFEQHGFSFDDGSAQISAKTIEILSTCVFARREEIQQIMVGLVVD